MSDDLFWPPLSGDGDDGERQPGEAEASGDQPTAAYPTGPLAGDAPQPADPGRSRRVGTIAIVAATAFVFGAGGVGVGAALVHKNNNSTSAPVVASNATVSPSALTTNPKTYAGIAAKVLPSVVSINVTGSSSSGESDTGSGIILQSDGYILTNNHVVAAAVGGGSVSVTFNDGSNTSAKIIGTDPLDDLAVIKVTKSGLSPATLGNSADIQVGDPVLAIGSPLGLTGTVTAGIVSALNRPVETQSESEQPSNPFGLGSGSTANPDTNPIIDAIQTDAAINPGNSGGALVDTAGDVVGINSAIASLGSDSLGGSSQSGNIGVGFAIPINEARAIATELINTGHANHPLLGVSLEDSTSSTGLDRAIVHSVTSGGPAAKAGIKEGDVITAVDGSETEGADAVIAAIRSHQPGQQVTVTVLRDGSSKTVTATLTTQSSTTG
jgi:putative serine protease PepD